DYSRLIPEKFQAHVTVLAEDLARTLAAMGRMARDNSSIVRLEWSPESGLQVTVKGEAGESVQMGVPGTCDPPEQAGRIAFNISYLEQYLKGKQGMVKISVYRESGPALLTYHGRGDHVLMPMFVAWDTPSPYPPEPEPEPAAAADTPPSVEPLATEPVDVGETGDAEVVYGDTTTEDIEVDTAPEAAVSEAPSAPADIPVDTAPAKPKRTRKAKAAKAA
ncbi:MAG: hypothetical protein HYY01_08170, partial [Chloroflexi bacterium]|nr:hypothetical protein [Chloroflexota bacterium]